LIITPLQFNETIQSLVDWKLRSGLSTKVLTVEFISENFQGRDLAEKIRSAIKYEYYFSGVKWVLLVGDSDSIPPRCVYVPDNASEYSPFEANKTVSDLYYACLEGNWDQDEDGIYGEFSLDDEVDWTPEVYVGRLPVNNIEELKTVLSKIIDYHTKPEKNNWASTFLLLGAVLNYDFEDNWGKSTDGAYLNNFLESEYIPDYFNKIRLYESTYDYCNFDNLTTENVVSKLNLGASLVNWFGHGNPNGLLRKILADENQTEFELVFSIYDSPLLKNIGKYSFWYSCACSSAAFDYPDSRCLGEELLLLQNGGAISYIGSTRLMWYAINSTTNYDQEITFIFWEKFFEDPNHTPSAIYEAIQYCATNWESKNYLTDPKCRKDLLGKVLLGDPQLSIWVNNPKEMDVILPTSIVPGEKFRITVRDERGIPLSGVLVCASINNDYRYGETNDQGRVEFVAPDSFHEIEVTMSKKGFIVFKSPIVREEERPDSILCFIVIGVLLIAAIIAAYIITRAQKYGY